jgi:hypothetical protein
LVALAPGCTATLPREQQDGHSYLATLNGDTGPV